MRKCLAGIGFAAVFLAEPGCGSTTNSIHSSTAAAPTASYHCGVSDGAPSTLLAKNGADEPTLAIPIPQGWRFSDKHNSSLVRGAILNEGLQANGFVPNAVVTLADVTGDASTTEKAIITERAGLAQKVTIDSQEPGTVCDCPSLTLDYKYDGRQATTVIVAAKDPQNKVWVSTVGIQTTEPDNPLFVTAKRTILDGFQFLVPNSKT